MTIDKKIEKFAKLILTAIDIHHAGIESKITLDTLIYGIETLLNEPTSVMVYQEQESLALPKYMHPDDFCMDIYAKEIEMDYLHETVIVHTGLHMALPHNYEFQVRPRSNIVKTWWFIPNTPGTVDENYRGEVLVCFKCNGIFDETPFPYKVGERVAQGLITRREKINWVPVGSIDDLGETDRGKGGHGSTGNE